MISGHILLLMEGLSDFLFPVAKQVLQGLMLLRLAFALGRQGLPQQNMGMGIKLFHGH